LGHSVNVVTPYHPQLVTGLRNGVTIHNYRVPGDSSKPLWGYAESLESDVKLKAAAVAVAPFALHQTYWHSLSIARQTKPDLIHAHWVLPNGFPASLVAGKLGLPLVVSLHGSDMFLAGKNWIFRKFASSVFQKASFVTACSPDLQAHALDMHAENVRVLEYGVDVNHFHPGSHSQRGSHSIFAVGRLVHKKGFAQLLEAFAGVRRYYNDSILTIAGTGPLLPEFQDLSKKLGITESVRFPGNLTREVLPKYYESADLVVVPSVTDAYGNRDGLPNVFLEALSSGCAVVASDIPGIQNVVRDGKSAMLVPSGNVPALRDAILHLFGNPNQIEALRAESRKKAISELSWEAKSRELENIYQSLLIKENSNNFIK
jgi:phosphatidyl-myo-inositol dimannoside synthase